MQPEISDSALIDAVKRKNWKLATELITSGASIRVKDELGETPLMWAVRAGDIKGIWRLWFLDPLQNIEEKNLNGESALMCGVLCAQWDAVKRLQKLGAQINTTNHKGDTPLTWAANQDRVPDRIKQLLKLGAQLETKNANDETALMCAVSKAIDTHEWEVVDYLISQKASLHAKNVWGYTPLMLLTTIKNDSSFDSRMAAWREARVITYQDISYARTAFIKQQKWAPRIREAGNILGFTKTISDVKATVITMGSGYSLLKKELKRFLANLSPTNQDFILRQYYMPKPSPIRQTLKLAIECLGHTTSKPTYFPTLITHYTQGKPVILPVRWVNHGIALVAWNDILAICNPGDNSLKDKICIFKIPSVNDKPGMLSEDFFKSIMPQNTILSADKILALIAEWVPIANPILSFSGPPQKRNTCAFTNAKLSLLPLLYFFNLLPLEQSDPKSSLETFSSTFLTTEQSERAKQTARMEYKTFTKTMRDLKIQELCNVFTKSSSESEELETRKIHLEILTAFLSEHHAQHRIEARVRPTEKIASEKERVLKILSVITPTEKKEMFDNLPLSASQAIQALTLSTQTIKKKPPPTPPKPPKSKVTSVPPPPQRFVKK